MRLGRRFRAEWLHVAWFYRRARIPGGKHLAALLFHLLNFFFNSGDDLVEFFNFFEEVADIKEGVAIESYIDEGRLHAWQHSRDSALIDAPD